MIRWYLAATVSLLPLAAVAQPACTTAAPNALPCQSQAVNPQPNDILYMTQVNGPQRPNQTDWITLKGLAAWLGPAASITATGAACDGVTDDTAVINAYLATFTTGAHVHVPAGRMCLINSGNLAVPANVILEGDASPFQEKTTHQSSGFYVNPAYTISMGANSSLLNIAVIRPGLIVNPTDAQVIAAVAQWGAETSVGVTMAGGDVTLEHVFIEGYNLGAYSYSDRVNMFDVQGDCYNGVYGNQIGDNFVWQDVRWEPFYAINSSNADGGENLYPSAAQGAPGTALQFAPGSIGGVQAGDYAAELTGTHVNDITYGTTVATVNNATGVVVLSAPTLVALQTTDIVTFGGAWGRPGFPFYIQGINGGTTGWYCVRCFSFAYQHGAVIDSVGIGTFAQSGFEHQHMIDPGTNGQGMVGFRLVGGSAGPVFTNDSASGFATDWSLEQNGHGMVFQNIDVGWADVYNGPVQGYGPSAQTEVYYGGTTDAPTQISLSGSIISGTSITLSIQGTSITYTAPRSMGFGEFTSQFVRLINQSNPLIWQRIAAYTTGSAIVIYGPYDTALSVSVSSVTGLTYSTTTLAALFGAGANIYGLLGGSAPPSALIPTVSIGPYDLPLIIGGQSADNSGGIPQYTYSIDSRNTTAAIQWNDWPAANANIGNVSGCGTGGNVASGSNEMRGTIVEGTGATGCTFSVSSNHILPRAPICLVTPAGNSAPVPASVTPSVNGFSYTHVSGSNYQYSYSCRM